MGKTVKEVANKTLADDNSTSKTSADDKPMTQSVAVLDSKTTNSNESSFDFANTPTFYTFNDWFISKPTKSNDFYFDVSVFLKWTSSSQPIYIFGNFYPARATFLKLKFSISSEYFYFVRAFLFD